VSRIGKNPVIIPAGVQVAQDGNTLTIKGPKGELTYTYNPAVTVSVTKEEVTVTRPSDIKQHRALHGTTRALVQNMILGVVNGFKKDLEVFGVGYRFELVEGKFLMVTVGYSHQIALLPPSGITITVPSNTTVSVSGIDKQLVGQIAAKIRSFRPPEPYKGKGIKYAGEQIRRKAGKTAKS
jgi:large subunit ribosomal protein L6